MDLTFVKDHYQSVFEKHGDSALGFGWKTQEDWDDRLAALASLVEFDRGAYTLNDWGCGNKRALRFFAPSEYHGYDLNPHKDVIVSPVPTVIADYTIANGTFNVKGKASWKEWERYVLSSVLLMHEWSRKGFGFNLLSDYATRRNDDLFYANPYVIAQHCRAYGRLSLLQNYSPWDFTILVHKC